ncbi:MULTISPECIES: SCO family protein [Gracilibacillus]|uniref:SCO family protein n=1 Tax=Gracilibacillus TaxID=74385 RepID=UPI00098EF012|nr:MULTISPECIES: SCO family protein [Gracilibacillus]
MVKKVLLLTAMLLLLAACGDKYEGDFSYEIEDFTYTDQDNQSFSKEALDGKFWIADMMFTNCNSICPAMTANMSRLQDMLADEGIDNVEMVSFSVDPTVDEPEMLKQYIEDRGGDFDNWHALTGYSNEDIKAFARDSFKAIVEHPDNDDQVIHQGFFYLVTPEGNAIKRYSGQEANEMEKIVEDLKAMN